MQARCPVRMPEIDPQLPLTPAADPPGETVDGPFANRLARLRRMLLWLLPVLGVSLGLVAAWNGFSRHEDGPTPAQQLELALRLLEQTDDVEARGAARDIARHLEAADYRDPGFSGGVEFVLGIAAFRDAESMEPLSGRPLYELAAEYLREAEQRVLPEEWRAEWAYALGASWYRLGRVADAQPLLESAAAPGAPHRTAAALLLGDIYLDRPAPERLEDVLRLTAVVIGSAGANAQQQVQARIQRARALLALRRTVELEQELSRLRDRAPEEFRSQGMLVFRAQALMAAGKHQDAAALLQPVAHDVGLNPQYPREASYLLAVAYDAQGKTDEAVNWFDRTAERYAESQEALAANVRMGELLQGQEKHEQARDAYRRALRMVQQPRDFRNRWLTLDEFSAVIRRAWERWCTSQSFSWAIDLSREMTPLLTHEEARQREARANQLWAEHLQQQYDQATWARRQVLVHELRLRWRHSGEAFSRFAETVRASARYPDELWVSAEHYYRGGDLDHALAQFTRFINTRPTKGLALALVRRGRVLLDLDRVDEAREHFERVVERHPSDPAAFEARYLIGICHREQDRLDQAEQVWREILTSDVLRPGTSDRPGAREWAWALLDLGRLLYDRGESAVSRERPSAETASTVADVSPELQKAFDRWDESARRLDEFLRRYPDDPQALEARYLLAKVQQRRADLPRRKLQTVETDNARQELQRSRRELLRDAAAHYQRLQRELLRRDGEDRLDVLGRNMLRECHFEIAHTFFDLEQYQDAILAYSTAANKFPEDPRVLLAYVQMSNCYDLLGKADEARSMLEQARVIISQLDASVFEARTTNMNRQEWSDWLDWARDLRRTDGSARASAP